MTLSPTRHSTVIKRGQAGPILKRLSTVDLADHLSEARQIVSAARRTAEQAVSQAEAKSRQIAEETRQAAHKEGYQGGFDEGQREGHRRAYEDSIKVFEEKHAGVVSQMLRAVDQIDRIKEQVQIAAEKSVLEFAITLAKKCTFDIGRLSRESVTANLARAIRLAGSRTDLVIRVNPKDHETAETYAAKVLQRIDASPAQRIVCDESIAPGGCRVSTDDADVDATLETQVAEITGLLLGTAQTETPTNEAGEEA